MKIAAAHFVVLVPQSIATQNTKQRQTIKGTGVEESNVEVIFAHVMMRVGEQKEGNDD
jgi:predicted XRE-type DNA-binding protein